MGDPDRAFHTGDEYLAWETAQPGRHELVGGQVRALGGGTAGRDTICLNLRSLLRDSLRGTPCRPQGPVFRVSAENGNVRYPTGLIGCGEPRGGNLFAAGPVAVFEVYIAVRFPDSRMSDYDATRSIRNCIVTQAG